MKPFSQVLRWFQNASLLMCSEQSRWSAWARLMRAHCCPRRGSDSTYSAKTGVPSSYIGLLTRNAPSGNLRKFDFDSLSGAAGAISVLLGTC